MLFARVGRTRSVFPFSPPPPLRHPGCPGPAPPQGKGEVSDPRTPFGRILEWLDTAQQFVFDDPQASVGGWVFVGGQGLS